MHRRCLVLHRRQATLRLLRAGEIVVFVFFGLVATLGTTWVQALALPQEAWFGAVGAGSFACAVLLANNLRDIDQDRAAGKRTLSVLIGRRGSQVLFTVLVLAPFVISGWIALFYPIAWLTLFGLLAALPAVLIVWTYRLPRELVVALALRLAGLADLRGVLVLGVRRLTGRALARGVRTHGVSGGVLRIRVRVSGRAVDAHRVFAAAGAER